MAQLNLGGTASGKNVMINDTNFGDIAMSSMKQFFKKSLAQKGLITITKLRSILEMVNAIYYNVLFITDSDLTENLLSDIAYLKVKMAYESSRENSVKEFINHTNIMNSIDAIVNSKKKDDFLLYCRYIESLVAYFKFEEMLNREERNKNERKNSNYSRR